jgi:hypothetical protein
MPEDIHVAPSDQARPYPKPKGPIVFHFQPTEYEVITTNEEYEVWERLMIERCGFDKNSPILQRDAQGQALMIGRGTFCHCPRRDD